MTLESENERADATLFFLGAVPVANTSSTEMEIRVPTSARENKKQTLRVKRRSEDVSYTRAKNEV